MNKKEKIAQIIRILTVPPVLVTIMLVNLFLSEQQIFQNQGELWASLELKRHKKSGLVAGSLVCLISFGIAYLLTLR